MKIAMGVMRREYLSPQRSDIHPSIVGDMASPRACIIKILTAKALARTDGCVKFTIIVLSGPVLRNRKNSAKNIAIRQLLSIGVTRA
jgi:hypothetical protein